MQGLKRVWRAFKRLRGGQRCRVLAFALLCVQAFGPGCQEHQLGGQELQTRKVETLRQHQGQLTAEEEYQISTIQARTGSEYDRSVARILAARKEGKMPGGGAGASNLKKD